MKTTGSRCRAVIGAAVLLSVALSTALAGVGDLTYVKTQPQGLPSGGSYYPMTKAADPAAVGLKNPQALVVANGALVKVAFDSDDPKSEVLDVARIDSSGKGDFSKARTVKLTLSTIKLAGGKNTIQTGSFAAQAGEIVKDGQKVPAVISGRYSKTGDRHSGSVSALIAAEGECRFGDVVRKVYVADTNRTLEVGDVVTRKVGTREYKTPDTCVIADEAGRLAPGSYEAMTRMGDPVQVGGKWYTLSGGQMKIKAEPLAGGVGKLAIDSPAWQVMLTNKDMGNLTVKGGKEPVEIPAGEYQLRTFRLYSDADTAKAASVVGSLAKAVNIEAGKTATLAFGSDITMTVKAVMKEDKMQISAAMSDSAGARISAIYGPGSKRPPAPQVEVVDKSGQVVHTGTLAYG